MCMHSFFVIDDSKETEEKNKKITPVFFNKVEMPDAKDNEIKNPQEANIISAEKTEETRTPPVWICP